MRVEQHAVMSAVIAGAVWAVSRSWEMALSSFLAGIFLDVDHVVEYVREFGWKPDLRQFFRASYEREYQRAVLVFHAWEWLPLIVLFVWWTGANPWAAGAAVGWFQHLACDQLANTNHAGAYFITWRWKHRFDHDTFFPPLPPR
jgi:hypothetical protein